MPKFSFKKQSKVQEVRVNEIFDSPAIYKQIFNYDNLSKFTVIEGGRASCKTQETATFLLRESFRFKDSVILCGREYQTSIKESVYKTLDKLIKAPKVNKLTDYFRITDKEITNLLTNTTFIFRGFNDFKKGSTKKSSNLNKVKSLSSIIYVWIDESQDITSNTLDVLIPTGREFIVTFIDANDYQEDINLDKDTKFIFTMNRQTNEDAVLTYFNDYGDMFKKYKVNIFDLEPKFQNKAMLKLAETQINHPNYAHIWLGEAKIDVTDSLFPFDLFKVDNSIDFNDLNEIVVAVDPAGGSNLENDETGIVVCGYSTGLDRFVILEDASNRYTPNAWAKKVNALYNKYKANRVIVETNFGGALVESNLKSINTFLPIYKVHAKKGKSIRAEHISSLFSEEKVLFFKRMPELQNQLNGYTPSGYKLGGSPDRGDACVYALTYLLNNYQKKVGVYVLDF